MSDQSRISELIDLISDMRDVDNRSFEQQQKEIRRLECEAASWKESHEGQTRNTLAFCADVEVLEDRIKKLDKVIKISAELLKWHEQELPKLDGHLSTAQARAGCTFEGEWEPCGDIVDRLRDALDRVQEEEST